MWLCMWMAPAERDHRCMLCGPREKIVTICVRPSFCRELRHTRGFADMILRQCGPMFPFTIDNRLTGVKE